MSECPASALRWPLPLPPFLLLAARLYNLPLQLPASRPHPLKRHHRYGS